MKRRVLKPNVIGGGQAIPMGDNFYYMKGRKHSQGGIDIGANPRTGLEVEDGEVMHLTDKDVRVYSSVPFLNGKSPAQKVMGGENPTKVFNEQERYKRRKGINDDGSRKKAMGGKTNNEELGLTRRQYRTGGLYSLTVNGETRMRQFPTSTGERTKAQYGTTKRTPAESKRLRERGLSIPLEKISIDTDNRVYSYLNGWRPYIFKDGNTTKKTAKVAKTQPNNTTNTNNSVKQVSNVKADVTPTRVSAPAKRYTRRNTNVNKQVLPKAAPLTNIGLKPLHEFKATPAKFKSPTFTAPDLGKLDYVDVPTPKKQNWINRTMNKLGVTPNDVASLIPNIAGSFITHSINSRMLNNFREPEAPIARQAVKLKTRINIEPQLDKMRESLAEYERQVDNNTASSNVALARKNNFRLANIMNTNALYADKENKETALINQDRLNRQSVTDANVREYNDYLARRNQYQNTIAEKKAENSVGLINNINAGIQNMLSNIDRRKAENRNIAAMAFAHPDLPIELFDKAGIVSKEVGDWYREGIGRNRRGMKKTI